MESLLVINVIVEVFFFFFFFFFFLVFFFFFFLYFFIFFYLIFFYTFFIFFFFLLFLYILFFFLFFNFFWRFFFFFFFFFFWRWYCVMCSNKISTLRKLLKFASKWLRNNELQFGINKCCQFSSTREKFHDFLITVTLTLYLSSHELFKRNCYTYLDVSFEKWYI